MTVSTAKPPAASSDAWNSPSWARAAQQYHAERKREPHRAAKPLLDRDYVLAELRWAWHRAETIKIEIEIAASALKRGLISPEQAIELLDGEIEPQFEELPTVEDAA